MSTKPTLPKGTRDFGPEVMLRRNYILETIKGVFSEFGFQPLETPAMENLSVLTGKYGEEGDRLLYRILNSGDFLGKVPEESRNESSQLGPLICDKGLRYDLTVPFARFVAANRHELPLPFKRYQVQPVWRADRPQKGRYREFFQCDADVVGSNSLLCEAEIVLMINSVFNRLGIKNYTIKINHRMILEGICELLNAPGKLQELSVAIDKLDKIGWEGVEKELTHRGFEKQQVEKAREVFGWSTEKLFAALEDTGGQKGVNDVKEFQRILSTFDPSEKNWKFESTLARGLSYYTGMIFEVDIDGSGVGSVSGGGRYDDLTGMFGGESLPGVGFSFGVDRLYDAMDTLGLFPEEKLEGTKVLITHFDKETQDHGFMILNHLRSAGIASELYPDLVKLKKQLGYADRKGIPYVILIGSEEMTSGKLTFKDMRSGNEEKIEIRSIIDQLKEN